jgi:WD40 repeat protein
MRYHLSLSAILAIAATSSAAPPEKPAPTPIAVVVPVRKDPVSFAQEVAEILGAKCVGCHGEALSESKLSLEDVPGMLKGGKRGPAIVAGKAEESLLFQMAAHRVEPVMPPKDKKEQTPLTPEELGVLKLWIDAGAKDDSDTTPEPARTIELGALPPGVEPIVAVDLTGDGARVAAGRANVVQVYDVDSGLEIVALGGHKDIIQSLRFSPDGRRLAAGSYQIVTVWDVPTGGPLRTFAGHSGGVTAVAPLPLPDGSGLVSAGLDRSVRFWDRDGKPTRQIALPAPVQALAVAPGGRRLAVGGSDGTVRIVRTSDGKEAFALKAQGGAIAGVVFLGGGERVAWVSADGSARLWRLPQDEEDEAFAEPLVPAADAGPLRAIAADPGGKRVAVAGETGDITLWDTEASQTVRTIPGGGAAVAALAFNPGGNRILAGLADGTGRLYDVEGGAPLRTLGGHVGPVRGVAFSPDGSRAATAGGEGGVKIWETASGLGVIAFGHTPPKEGPMQPIHAVAFTEAGAIVTASADTTLRSWAFAGAWSLSKTLGPHAFRVLSLDFNPDGTLLAAGGGEPSRSGEIKLWELGKGILVRSLDAVHSDTVFGVRFSPDGTLLASAGADKFLKVTRVIDGKELKTFEGHTHHVLAVDWSADGKQLASGGGDNVVKVWDYATGEALKTLPPAGKQVTAVRWVAGKTPLVAGASGDRQVRLWNPEGNRGQVARTFTGPSDYVFGVAASGDGSRVAAGGADGVLFVWKAENGQVLRKIEPRPRPPSAPPGASGP